MKSLSQRFCWTFIVATLAAMLSTAYLMQFGYQFKDPKNWQYQARQCTLQCADQGCIHHVAYPVLYRRLVQPQVDALKMTGTYKLANLLVYFIGLPLFYAGWLTWMARSRLRRIPVWLTVIVLLITGLAGGATVNAMYTLYNRDVLYWGATNWCVLLANRFQVSLLDVYTLIFGLAIPLSVAVILMHYLTYCLLFFRAQGRVVQ